VVDVFTTEVE